MYGVHAATFGDGITTQMACGSNCGFKLCHVGCAQTCVLALPVRRGKQLQLAEEVFGQLLNTSWVLRRLGMRRGKAASAELHMSGIGFYILDICLNFQNQICAEKIFSNRTQKENKAL